MPDLTQLGFGLGALALIWVVVQYFIKAIDKKDTQISTMVASFNETINNHIIHETEQSKKQTAVLRNLNKSINLLIKKVTK